MSQQYIAKDTLELQKMKDAWWNHNQKKAQVAIMYFGGSNYYFTQKGHCVMTNISIYQKNITIINIVSPGNRTPKFMKRNIFKGPNLLFKQWNPNFW